MPEEVSIKITDVLEIALRKKARGNVHFLYSIIGIKRSESRSEIILNREVQKTS